MDIAYSINEKYVGYCLVSIASLLDTNKASTVVIHILYDDLSLSALARIEEFIEERNGFVQFHRIETNYVEGLILNSWPKSAWYRIFLPYILSKEVNRVLYLDSDTVVSGSISELFEMDMKGNSLAGCVDVMTLEDEVFERLDYTKDSGYICSGVLLMNLDHFRKHDLTREILCFARTNSQRLKYPDQDAINYVCRDSKILLPLKYETMNSYFRSEKFVSKYKEEFSSMITDPRIIHYAGCPPWFIETNVHPFTDLFWHYARLVGGIKMLHFSVGNMIPKNLIKYLLGRLGLTRYSGHCKLDILKFTKTHNIRLIKR